jgi:D-Tyr-tRNAtyr deacylase
MKLIVTPVIRASVEIQETKDLREIPLGLLIYVGIGKVDLERSLNSEFLEKIVQKIISTKLFHSAHTDKIDMSVQDV